MLFKKFIEKFNRLVPEELCRLERMLKGMSDFSIHSKLNISGINIRDLLKTIGEIMNGTLRKNKVVLKYALESDNLFLKGDSERLKQVFMNLIINAINAMPKGGLLIITAGMVSSKDKRGSQEIEIRVKDTGEGIAPEALEEIFEPFYTKDKGGMGLGLAISRRIIEQHGGNIKVESKTGEGATFIIRLSIRNGSG